MFLIPLIAWWMNISLVQAFLLDLALILFIPCYTFAFNWSYDHLRAIIVARQVRKKAPAAA